MTELKISRYLLFIFSGVITIILILASCSEDLGSKVDEILLTVNKNVALSSGDSVLIFTEIHNHIDERLTGIPLRYFANEEELDGPIFKPTSKGVFLISARHEEVVSTKQRVDVISLEDNITSLKLKYDGNPYLTTEEWSVTGTFSFEVQVDNLDFQIETSDIELLLDNVPVEQRSGFHFNQPGTYLFKAAFANLKSIPIEIQVRPASNFHDIELPVVFHFYNIDYNISGVQSLLDTLNGAFNKDFYNVQDVKDGIVNPNATDLNMTFVPVDVALDGFNLAAPGIHQISEEIPGNNFTDIATKYTWDPVKFINVWIYDFQMNFYNDPHEGYADYARGAASRPILDGVEFPGFLTTDDPAKDPIAGILVEARSVFIEHRDYIVSMMGVYLGLYDTFEKGCLNEGDFCKDTPSIDPMNNNPVTNYFYTCEERSFTPSNYMSFNRRYRDFTHDQGVRMGIALRSAISRPRPF